MGKKTVTIKCPECNTADYYWEDDLNVYRCNYCKMTFVIDNDSLTTVLATIRTCPKCGTDNSLDNRFCKKCGQLLRINCPNCGKLIDSDSIFCSDCKVNIKAEITRRKKEEQKRYIEKLNNDLSSTEKFIRLIENKINDLNSDISEIQTSSGRLYLLGKVFLSDSDKTLYELSNADFGCLFRIFSNIIGYFATSYAFQIILASIGARYDNFNPKTIFQHLSNSDMFSILFFSFFGAITIGHVATAIVYLIRRQINVDQLINPYRSNLINTKKELAAQEEIIIKLNEQLAEANKTN
ncbi:MAG: zinc ribbon domain-containing protein [Pelolinea sp.]|nr:zinc ribbon domain-containing protein [Pelolinea sp.]